MIQIHVKVDDKVSDELRDLVDALTGSELAELNSIGGKYATNAATEWHREFNGAGGWRGDRYMQGSVGRPGEWGENVAQGWAFRASDKDGATIGNDADHYAFKVRGGTIRPKRVSWLTLPLIPEAKGRRAADYAIDFNTRLFRPKGKNVLMEKTGKKTVRSVYALVKSVTLSPFPQGVPPEQILAESFTAGWREGLADKIEML